MLRTPAAVCLLIFPGAIATASETSYQSRANLPVSVEPFMTVELPSLEPETLLLPQPPAYSEMSQDEQPIQPVDAASEAASSEVETKPAPEQVAAIVDPENTPILPAIERMPLGQGAVADGSEKQSEAKSSLRGIARTGGALAAVIGLILILRFIVVKFSGATGGLRAQLGAAGKAPSGVLFVLGRYPVSRGMSLVLLQLDQRVILLSQTASGFQTLAELSDPEEVASIIRKVKDESGESLGAKFGSMLKQFERDPETITDLEPAADSAPVRLRRPVEAEADETDQGYARFSGYYEEKPHTLPRTGEDELRSRINRLREYGS